MPAWPEQRPALPVLGPVRKRRRMTQPRKIAGPGAWRSPECKSLKWAIGIYTVRRVPAMWQSPPWCRSHLPGSRIVSVRSAMTDTQSHLTAGLADRYRLERELGAGGMATVYLAYDLRHERKVAIKVLKPELSAVIGAERFLREIKTIATLQHPHILGLIDSGEVNGTAYYVMPFVEGESLRDRLNREKQLAIHE